MTVSQHMRQAMLKNLINTTITKQALLLMKIFLFLAVGCSQQSSSKSADTVYKNGRIYTVNEAQPWAEAIAIKDGKFLVVGTNEDVEVVTGETTKVIDLEGRMAMPGLIDVHVHPLGVANSWANLQIKNPSDADAILEEVREYAKANPDLPMVRGEAWNLGVFPNDSPRKELLDEIVSDRPVYLQSQTGHSAWANSKALEIAGITKDTPITEKFIYDKDPKTGEPSGTVREFAMGAIEQVLPATNPDLIANALNKILDEFNSFGFTTLKPAEAARHWMEGAQHLGSQGGLKMRLFPAWDWRSHYSPHTDQEQDDLIKTWKDFESELISPRYVKMFYDGGPDSHTAALFEDYVGRPGFKGKPTLPKDEFLKAITQFNANGLGVLVHVMGDAGGQEVVDIFEKVRKRNGNNGVPMHLSHSMMIKPKDIERLSKVKETCIDFSPVLAYPAPAIRGSFVPPIGEERYQQFYNVRSAFESGIPVGFGSDWASSLIPDPNGFHQMQSWVTRQDPEDPTSGTLNADQKITLEQAVRGYTLGGAECIGFGWDKKIGSIEEGKLADFIVLDHNIFEIPIKDLHKTLVERTVFGGEVIFDRKTDAVDDLIDEQHFSPGTRYMH